MSPPAFLTSWQQLLLVLLRFSIGWHLFYQGFGKAQAVRWSAQPYLSSATGPFASLFHWMAASPRWLGIADTVTVWGLMIAGFLLMIGLFTRTASIAGILLLVLFFAAQPPFPRHGFAVQGPEGSELYVNKVFIEILALALTAVFNTGRISGLDMLVSQWIRKKRFGMRDGAETPAAAQ